MNIGPNEFEEEPQSPENIRFTNVTLDLYPDRRRVKVGIHLTPFKSPPNIEIDVHDASENLVANATIIGVSGPDQDITLHLRGELTAGDYVFFMTLGYQDQEIQDRKEVAFRMPEPENLAKE